MPAGGVARTGRSLHAVTPAAGDGTARTAPARPATTRLFPPRPSEEPHARRLQFVEGGRVAVTDAYASAATTPPRVTRSRLLVGLLLVLVVVQSGLLVWWMRSDRTPIGGAASTAPVTITSAPSGSVVVVDGSRVGTTPLTTPLAAGSHELQVGNEAPQTLTVEAGVSASMHVVLSPAAAAVRTGIAEIITDPPGAAITVDGVPRGVSPVQVGDLKPGTHAVTLARAGRLLRRTITVQAGGKATLSVPMDAGASGSGSGWLTVTSPVPAQIYADGTLIGRTDAPRTQLSAGRHQLALVNDALNYREERIVEVAAGRTVSVQLEPVNGTLNINAQPWAAVWVDGTAIGETPIGNYSLPIGSHEVVLRHPELGERKQTVVVGVGSPTRVGVDLRK